MRTRTTERGDPEPELVVKLRARIVRSGRCRERGCFPRLAGVAQLVEQLIRNQQVTRSSRVAGSIFTKKNREIALRMCGMNSAR
jgi:hypothetical protein